MAFCRNCGTQLNDEAKFCPKCGQTIDGGGSIPQQQENQFQQQCDGYEEEVTLKTWQKIASILVWPAGVALTVAAFVRKQTALAKSALIYTIIGVVLSVAIQALADYEGESNSIDSDVAEAGYNDGYETGFTFTDIGKLDDTHIRDLIKTSYSAAYGSPSTPDDKQMFQIYKENYEKGLRDGQRAGKE